MFKYIVYILAVLICMSSCSVQDVDLVKVGGYNVGRTDEGKIRLTLTMTLNNPNNFSIKVKKTDLDLSISGSEAGKIELEDKVIILKKSESDYDFVLLADSKEVSRAIVQAGIGIALSGKVTLRVKGWIKG